MHPPFQSGGSGELQYLLLPPSIAVKIPCRLRHLKVDHRDATVEAPRAEPPFPSQQRTTMTRFSAPAAKANHAAMHIRSASSTDAPAIWSIIEPVIRAGETYTLDRNLSRAEALAYWMGADKKVFVAEQAGTILGTYYMRPNQAGGGRHVCNCGYVTAPDATGKGVARSMCEHSMATARTQRYRAMQFNFVVSTNGRAVSLWQKMGFEVVGRLPGAFRHPTHGYVDALVMYQAL